MEIARLVQQFAVVLSMAVIDVVAVSVVACSLNKRPAQITISVLHFTCMHKEGLSLVLLEANIVGIALRY